MAKVTKRKKKGAPAKRAWRKALVALLLRVLRNPVVAWLLRMLRNALIIVLTIALLAVTGLRWVNPPTSALLWQANATAQADSPKMTLDWRPLEDISNHMAMAVVAAEDQRFLEHHGLDFIELYAVLRTLKDRPRGASTITQQVAKNLFLWKERSYLRKILETGLALYIDLAWGKRRVLEVYLNIVQFGPTTYGIENASQHFFKKSAAKLTPCESAQLASVLPNPYRRAPTSTNKYMLKRQEWILKYMRILGNDQPEAHFLGVRIKHNECP